MRRGGLVYIDQADPRVLISAELFKQAVDGEYTPYIQVTGDDLDVVTISDDYSQAFIYRLGNYRAEHDAFEMEWPD
jgi:hypothetical protein